MRNFIRFLIVIFLFQILFTSCDALLQTYVRFDNRSETKTVRAIWDGANMGDLAPGEKTEYREVNPGTHTLQWKNALNGKALTSIGWPNLVAGNQSTFPYTDP